MTTLIELLIPCLDTFSRVLRKKKPSKLRIRRSYTDCNLYWHEVECSGVEKHSLPPTSSPHLWDSCLTTITSVLRYYSEQTSPQKSLYCQYWRYENETSWAAEWWQRGQKVEVKGTTGGLERYRRGAPLSKSFIHLKSRLFRADKQAP